MKLKAKEKARIHKAIHFNINKSYYPYIPIDEINKALNTFGLILVDEDGTRLSALFCGESGEALLDIGVLSTEHDLNGLQAYDMIENSKVLLTWYKLSSRNYEIVCYVT